MLIGYARVSSKDQNLDRQIKELEEQGCEKIFHDSMSGKNFEREGYKQMKNMLRFGDVVMVHDLSRFGRSKEDIKNEWESLIAQEIDIVVLNMSMLDTRKYKDLEGVGRLVTDIVFQLLSWMVEEERSNIRKAQREGIEIAKQKGKYKGRPVKYHANAVGKDHIIYKEVVNKLHEGESVMNISKQTSLSRNTIYRIKHEVDNNDS